MCLHKKEEDRIILTKAFLLILKKLTYPYPVMNVNPAGATRSLNVRNVIKLLACPETIISHQAYSEPLVFKSIDMSEYVLGTIKFNKSLKHIYKTLQNV